MRAAMSQIGWFVAEWLWRGLLVLCIAVAACFPMEWPTGEDE